MSPRDAIAMALVALGVTIQAVSVAGVLAMPHLFDRLHYLTPASGLGPVLVAAGLVVDRGLDHRGLDAVMVALFLLLFSPVLTHATARAARVSARGDWRMGADEAVRGP